MLKQLKTDVSLFENRQSLEDWEGRFVGELDCKQQLELVPHFIDFLNNPKYGDVGYQSVQTLSLAVWISDVSGNSKEERLTVCKELINAIPKTIDSTSYRTNEFFLKIGDSFCGGSKKRSDKLSEIHMYLEMVVVVRRILIDLLKGEAVEDADSLLALLPGEYVFGLISSFHEPYSTDPFILKVLEGIELTTLDDEVVKVVEDYYKEYDKMLQALINR